MLPQRFLEQLGVFTQPGMLTADQCRSWWRRAIRAESRPAEVYRDGRSVLDESDRRVEEVGLKGEDKDRFSAQIEPLRPDLERHFGRTLGSLGEQQCLLYGCGDHFVPRSSA